jgi:diguanylate cyclase (GGDEF)-like protein
MHVDITERKLAEQELKRQAYQDPLTGLANRPGFSEAFSRHIDRHGWNPQDLIVLLDIREMRNVNDAHGYDIGDRLLIKLARRLERHLCDHTLIGRISGDQFILFLPDDQVMSSPERLDSLAEVFQRPVRIGEIIIEISARGGYTLLGEEERSAETLLHEVEIALHETRLRDTSEFYRYNREMDRLAQHRIDLTRDLRRALEEDQFELHYQPKVDLASGEVIGCEALIRWMHPERGMQMPGLFIPVAEQSQLIGLIGDWVLFEACRHLREWQEAGLDLVRVSVNVSVDQFRLGDFTRKVQEALETHAIDPAALTLEITESVFSEESESLRRQIQELHSLGVRLSLDDFGTGYSSLLYLQQYPFDEIKIGFVRRILDGQSMKGAEFAGAFGIEGLLAVLDLCARRVEGAWIILDGIDQLLRRQPDSQRVIDLQSPIDSGQLRVVARASWDGLVEEHYMAVLALLDDFQPECLVIDPASALLKSSGAESAFLAVTRTRGITTMITSLSEADDPFGESSLSHASTLADTWIVLRYQISGGERNRSLSVVKSRGTAHSNQVREMILSSHGVDLADVYPFGSEVLMGTARVQKES